MARCILPYLLTLVEENNRLFKKVFGNQDKLVMIRIAPNNQYCSQLESTFWSIRIK